MLKKTFAIAAVFAFVLAFAAVPADAGQKKEDIVAYGLFQTSTANWHLNGASEKVVEKGIDEKAFALYNTSTKHWAIDGAGEVVKARKIDNKAFSLYKSSTYFW